MTASERKRRASKAEKRTLARLDGRPESVDELTHALWVIAGRLQSDIEGLDEQDRERCRVILLALHSALESVNRDALKELRSAGRKVLRYSGDSEFEQLARVDIDQKGDAARALVTAIQDCGVCDRAPSDQSRQLKTLACLVARLPWCDGLSIDDITDRLKCVEVSTDAERTAEQVLKALGVAAKDARNALFGSEQVKKSRQKRA